MALQQNKVSKRRSRNRKGANRYKGFTTTPCTHCGAPRIPHRVCQACGHYNGKQIITVVAK